MQGKNINGGGEMADTPTFSDINEFKKEVREDLRTFKKEVKDNLVSMNDSIKDVLIELKTIAIEHTKSISSHEIEIVKIKAEHQVKPSRICEDTIRDIADEHIKTNNLYLEKRHTEIHTETAKNKLNFIDILIKIAVGILSIWGIISGFILAFGGVK